MTVFLLIVAFVVILAGCELFVNGIEWFGRKLQPGRRRGRQRAGRGGHRPARDRHPAHRHPHLGRRGGRRDRHRRHPGRSLHALHPGHLRVRHLGRHLHADEEAHASRSASTGRSCAATCASSWWPTRSPSLVGIVDIGRFRYVVAGAAHRRLRRLRAADHEERGRPRGRVPGALLPPHGRVPAAQAA